MNAISEKIVVEEASPNKLRIKALVEEAAKRMGGYRQLAEHMDVHPQLISNWKNGVKTPSADAQADMAAMAGSDVLIAALMATMEKTTGMRHQRLTAAYKRWMSDQTLFQEWKRIRNTTNMQITSL